MNRIVVFLSFVAFGIFGSGCRDNALLYYSNPQASTSSVETQYRVQELTSATPKMDILWVIDNSGSMYTYQQAVIDNTGIFMDGFVQKKVLDWKMALISTDTADAPYVGMGTAQPLDHTMPDSVDIFKRAVARLGTYGSGIEMTFAPLEINLNRYPTFLRNDAILIIINVTDAPEQSAIRASDFMSFLLTKKSGNLDKIKMYGIYRGDEFGCPDSGEDKWIYKGSPYEEIVKQTRGVTYPICSPDFGKNLQAIGKDLGKLVKEPALILSARPIPSSIQVLFNDVAIPGGPPESGGKWLYDFDRNAILFSDLSFAGDDPNATVLVRFNEDLGTAPGP